MRYRSTVRPKEKNYEQKWRGAHDRQAACGLARTTSRDVSSLDEARTVRIRHGSGVARTVALVEKWDGAESGFRRGSGVVREP